jgi:hypothetical protein
MSLEGILIAVVLTGLVGLWVGLPLLRRETASGTQTTLLERQRERLTIYYARILRNMQDLDEDFTTGKLSDTDYRQEREMWAQRGIAVLKALDESQLLTETQADDASIDTAIDSRIEAAINAYRQEQPSL